MRHIHLAQSLPVGRFHTTVSTSIVSLPVALYSPLSFRRSHLRNPPTPRCNKLYFVLVSRQTLVRDGEVVSRNEAFDLVSGT